MKTKGTGYFLDRCTFPTLKPRLALMDLNPNSLAVTSRRIARYHPITYQRNVLEPIQLEGPKFDSIGLNYLLHCLPGTILTKAIVFHNIKPWLNPGGVIFGSTLLSGGVNRSFLARRLMDFYNKKGIFSNQDDNLEDLRKVLTENFAASSVKIIGCAALFWGRI